MVPPAIPGMGNTGGMQMQIEDRNALGLTEMQKAINTLLAAYGGKPALAAMNSSFEANVPQYYLYINREKAISMGIDIGSLLSTLSNYMGTAFKKVIL